MSLRFEDYLSCAYLGFGISTILTFAFFFLKIGTQSLVFGILLLMIPYLIGGFISGFLIGRKISKDLLISGLKCSAAASGFNIVVYFIFLRNSQGLIWLVLGYFIGTYSGIFIRMLINWSKGSS
jgi:hypothetical protein